MLTSLAHYTTKGLKKSMTVKELLEIISHLPEDTEVLIEQEETCDIETVIIQHHSDGRTHVVLSSLE